MEITKIEIINDIKKVVTLLEHAQVTFVFDDSPFERLSNAKTSITNIMDKVFEYNKEINKETIK